MHPTVILQHADKPAAVAFHTNFLLCINIHNKFNESMAVIRAAPDRALPFLPPKWHTCSDGDHAFSGIAVGLCGLSGAGEPI